MIIGIDHILIAVDDLNTACQCYQRLGFDVVMGGEHPRAGTHNALITLADGCYLELIAVKNPDLAQHVPFANQALHSLKTAHRLAHAALDSSDLQNDAAAIQLHGLAMENIIEGTRQRPDGQVLHWQMANCVDERLPFLIQDITARELRVPQPTKGIGVTSKLNKLVWQVPALEQRLKQFTQLLGCNPTGQKFQLQRGVIELVVGEKEYLKEVVLETSSLSTILKYWQDNNINFLQDGDFYSLNKNESCGAKLIFTTKP